MTQSASNYYVIISSKNRGLIGQNLGRQLFSLCTLKLHLSCSLAGRFRGRRLRQNQTIIPNAYSKANIRLQQDFSFSPIHTKIRQSPLVTVPKTEQVESH